MPGGNAKDWTYGDMLANEAEVSSASEPEWVVDQKTFMRPDELARSRAALEKAAGKNGKVIGVREVKGGFEVTVEHRNPRYKGKKGKR